MVTNKGARSAVDNFFDVQSDEVDPFAAALIAIGMLSGFAIAVFGVQSDSLATIAIGLTFALGAAVMLQLTGGALLTSGTNFRAGSFAFVAAQAPWVFPNLFSGNFSLFSLPTQDYLSILASLPPYIQAITNVVMAPLNETTIFLSAAILTYKLADNAGYDKLTSVAVISAAFSIGFAFLHGARSTQFIVTASLVMIIWLAGYLGEATGSFDVPLFDMTFGVVAGSHFANNVSASGGYAEVVSVLFSAPAPYIYLSYLLVGVGAVILLFGLGGAAAYVLNRF